METTMKKNILFALVAVAAIAVSGVAQAACANGQCGKKKTVVRK
jgi:hypothetical protein